MEGSFPELASYTEWALLALRLMLGVLFGSSGWSHARNPQERAKSIEMPVAFTFGLGLAELAGAASVAIGVWPQVGAAILILTMLGALYKKIFRWKTGFWGEGSQGWYYDLLYLVCAGVILTTGGGTWKLI